MIVAATGPPGACCASRYWCDWLPASRGGVIVGGRAGGEPGRPLDDDQAAGQAGRAGGFVPPCPKGQNAVITATAAHLSLVIMT